MATLVKEVKNVHMLHPKDMLLYFNTQIPTDYYTLRVSASMNARISYERLLQRYDAMFQFVQTVNNRHAESAECMAYLPVYNTHEACGFMVNGVDRRRVNRTLTNGVTATNLYTSMADAAHVAEMRYSTYSPVLLACKVMLGDVCAATGRGVHFKGVVPLISDGPAQFARTFTTMVGNYQHGEVLSVFSDNTVLPVAVIELFRNRKRAYQSGPAQPMPVLMSATERAIEQKRREFGDLCVYANMQTLTQDDPELGPLSRLFVFVLGHGWKLDSIRKISNKKTTAMLATEAGQQGTVRRGYFGCGLENASLTIAHAFERFFCAQSPAHVGVGVEIYTHPELAFNSTQCVPFPFGAAMQKIIFVCDFVPGKSMRVPDDVHAPVVVEDGGNLETHDSIESYKGDGSSSFALMRTSQLDMKYMVYVSSCACKPSKNVDSLLMQCI